MAALICINGLAGWHAIEGFMSERLRIATFNLENLGRTRDDSIGLDERIAALRPVLRRLRADVLCLQEVDGQKPADGGPRDLAVLEVLLANTSYAGFARCCTAGPGGGVRDIHNLVVLSRWPIVEHREIRHEIVPAPILHLPLLAEPVAATWRRPLLHAVIDLPGGNRLQVVNAHFRAPLAAALPGQKAGPFSWKSTEAWAQGSYRSVVERAGQALEARLLVDGLLAADPEALICLAGDFNATLDEMPLRLLLAAEEDTGNGHLAGRALTPLERSLPESVRHTVLHHGRPQMLDHILVSRALLGWYRQLEIHNEALADELVGYVGIEQTPGSLHAPVVAAFEPG